MTNHMNVLDFMVENIHTTFIFKVRFRVKRELKKQYTPMGLCEVQTQDKLSNRKEQQHYRSSLAIKATICMSVGNGYEERQQYLN